MQADLRLRLALYSPCSPVVGCDLIPMSWRRMAGSGKCRASASEESLHSRVTPHVKRSGCMRPMQGPCLPPLFMSACSNKAGLLSLHAFCTTLTVLSFSTAPFHSFGCRPVAISPIAILHPPQPPPRHPRRIQLAPTIDRLVSLSSVPRDPRRVSSLHSSIRIGT